MTSPITTGNTGQQWRATITPSGAVVPWDEHTPPIDWFVAAQDRWHIPAQETTVRQQRLAGSPVTETRLRVPNGDVVQRIYSTAHDGGLTIIEVENETPVAVAVAFDRRDVLTERPISTTPIEGIDLPTTAFVLPLGHAATLRIGIPHAAPRTGPLPAVPPVEQVIRGWNTITDRAGRYVLPDGEIGATLVERVLAQRCELVLGNIAYAADDPIGYTVGVDQMVRMGEVADHWMPELVEAVAAFAPVNGWAGDVALDAAVRIADAAGEHRAIKDLKKIRRHRTRAPRPATAPDGVLGAAWLETLLADGGNLLPAGIPPAWHGQSFAAYDLPTGPDSTVSYGIRWHGELPAILWEQTGTPVTLRATAVDAEFNTSDRKGETLWTNFGS